MKTLQVRLRADLAKLSWNRDPRLLTEAADELEKPKDEITTNAIIHVQEMAKLIKEINKLKHDNVLSIEVD